MPQSFLSGFINDTVTLFVAIDPIGTVPLLAVMTQKMKEADRSKLVTRGVMIATIVLVGFATFGHLLLHSMGISFSSFRIAGGIILFMVGIQMVFQDHGEALKPHHKDVSPHDLAVFPIALPYIAGPGSMLAIMVQTESLTDSPLHLGLKVLSLLLVMLVTLLILLSTTKLHHILGQTGSNVIGRVMGILLAALAAESVVRGILEAFGHPAS